MSDSPTPSTLLASGDEGLRPRSEWTFSDYAVEGICRVVGCRSVFARWQGWGYRLVCNPLCLWLLRHEDRKEAKR